MKKKNKLIIVFIILMLLLSFNSIYAHSVELDPESLIRLPMLISNGSGEITIDDTITNYTLYYQAVQIPSTIYSQIEKNNTDGKSDLDSLSGECNELETIYDKAYDQYKEGLTNKIDETELEKLKTAYETAQKNYKDKINDYNIKVEEINNKTKELTPSYIESNWIQTNDNKFSVDLTQFSGEQAFAIWVKLVTSDGTIAYDEGIYTMSGKKVEDTKENETQKDTTDSGTKPTETKKDTSTTDSGTQNKLTDSTVSKSKLPNTGYSYGILFAVTIIISALGVILYKKIKYLNFK